MVLTTRMEIEIGNLAKLLTSEELLITLGSVRIRIKATPEGILVRCQNEIHFLDGNNEQLLVFLKEKKDARLPGVL